MNEHAPPPGSHPSTAPTGAPISAHAVLRSRTADAHEAVDAAFGAFSFTDPASYTRMLQAHARVLAPLEALLRACPDLPPWRSRQMALAADLATLNAASPPPADTGPAPWSAPGLHGLLYVLEGSRLGGRMLSRQVPPGLPSAFLSAGHEKGEWRALLAALDARALDAGGTWMEEAVSGAQRAFALYGEAARQGA